MEARARSDWRWFVAAAGLVLGLAFGLRHGTGFLSKGVEFDERWIRLPIDDLLARGWSVETAIDFQETKGPAMIWPYALFGEAFGGDLNNLRLLSLLFFVGGVVPLLLIARRAGVRGAGYVGVAALYALLPQHAVLGQMLMSEASFVFGCLWLVWIFLWGFGEAERRGRRVAGPVLFGLLLAILLHHRVHAAAFAGAVGLVTLERDRLGAWPWWLACGLAAAARVPLWWRWGGLVSPEYQSMHGLGLGVDAATYLGAALLPLTGVFLAGAVWERIADRARPDRTTIGLILGGGLVGLGLGLVFPPDLRETLSFRDMDLFRFLGFTSRVASEAWSGPAAANAAMVAMSTLGFASLGALAAKAWSAPSSSGPDATATPPAPQLATVLRLQTWTLVGGIGMYALTYAYVFDRYLLPWAILLPIAWWRALPVPLRWAQGLLLGAMLAYYTRAWLVP